MMTDSALRAYHLLARLGFRGVPVGEYNPKYITHWRMRQDASGLEIEHWSYDVRLSDGSVQFMERYWVVQDGECVTDSSLGQAIVTAAWYASIAFRNATDGGSRWSDPANALPVIARHVARLSALEAVLRQVVEEP